jgi:hypothetical protein
MANVRLKTNVIAGGKFLVRGSVIDDAILPEHLKTEEYVAYDLEDRAGKVLLLRDLAFMSLPRPGADGTPTSFPIHLAQGELLDLSTVPEHKRQSLKEGEDFKTEWSLEEQQQLQKAQEDIYRELPEEAEEMAVPTASRSRFNRR